jgi:hypothetical protein
MDSSEHPNSGTGGSEKPARPTASGLQKWLSEQWLILVALILAAAVNRFVADSPWWISAAIVLGFLLLVVIFIIPPPVKWIRWALYSGLFVVVTPPLVWVGVVVWAWLDRPACPAPTQVRLLTAPEHLTTLQELVSLFGKADAASSEDGCYSTNVTVSAPPLTREELAEAFEENWTTDAEGKLASLGPRPDIWVPGSITEADMVLGESPPGHIYRLPKLTLERLGSVARSPLVVAIPKSIAPSNIPQTGVALADQANGTGESDLLDVIAKDLKVVMPDPFRSSAGLLHTQALSRDPRYSRLSLSGESSSVVCALRAGAAPQALLVSEQEVFSSNIGAALGPGCPARKPEEVLKPYYPKDAPYLDFPFFALTWGDRPSPRYLNDKPCAGAPAERFEFPPVVKLSRGPTSRCLHASRRKAQCGRDRGAAKREAPRTRAGGGRQPARIPVQLAEGTACAHRDRRVGQHDLYPGLRSRSRRGG